MRCGYLSNRNQENLLTSQHFTYVNMYTGYIFFHMQVLKSNEKRIISLLWKDQYKIWIFQEDLQIYHTNLKKHLPVCSIYLQAFYLTLFTIDWYSFLTPAPVCSLLPGLFWLYIHMIPNHFLSSPPPLLSTGTCTQGDQTKLQIAVTLGDRACL